MSSFKIELKGLNEELQKLNVERYKNDVNKALFKFGVNVERDAKQMAPVDEGRLRNAIFYQIGDLEVTVGCSVNYAAYLEFGTRRFASEYVSNLPADWQELAGKFKGNSSSGAMGIPAQPFLYPAVEKNRQQLINDISELINK